jgi:hypothetical protein
VRAGRYVYIPSLVIREKNSPIGLAKLTRGTHALQTLSACSSYFETLNFNELAGSLAAAIPPTFAPIITSEISETAVPTSPNESLTSISTGLLTTSTAAPTTASTAAPTTASTAAPSSTPTVSATPERGTGIPVAAILGIVFGFVGAVGALAGVVVWRYRQNRLS